MSHRRRFYLVVAEVLATIGTSVTLGLEHIHI